MADAREIIARTVFRTIAPELDWEESYVDAATAGYSYTSESTSLSLADAILTALSAAGLVLVPAEPSQSMLFAGHVAMENRLRKMVHDPHVMKKVWSAMIAAAQEQTPAQSEVEG